MKQIEYFKKKRQQTWLLFSGLIIVFIVATVISGFNLTGSLLILPQGLVWLGQNFLPNANTLTYLPLILSKLVETVLMSIAATSTAAILALIFSIIGSRELGLTFFLKVFVRLVASFFRNMPLVVWAMILLLSFKQSEFTGYLALSFTTFGYLTRAFVETIDEQSGAIVESLKASGANYLQIVCQGVIPMASSQLISWVLFLIENNIRDATLIGILTGTGIGFLFDLYYKRFAYDVVGLIILILISVVMALELLTTTIRRNII